MSSLLADAPLTQLIPTLWKCRPASMEEVKIGVHIPHTVIYEHNFPKGLFHTTTEGFLQRRIGKEIDSKTVVDVFCATAGASHRAKKSSASSSGGGASNDAGGAAGGSASGTSGSSPSPKKAQLVRRLPQSHDGASDADHDPRKSARTPDGRLDIVAVYIETKNDNAELAVQFLTDAGLRAFLLGSTAQGKASSSAASNPLGGMSSFQGHGGGADGGGGAFGDDPATAEIRLVQNKNGILQKFIYPIGVHNELIQVVWTSHLCIAEKLRSNAFLGDTTLTPYQRAATFQAPPTFSKRAYVAPHIAEAIRAQCELLVDQIYVVEHKLVEQLTLYFKVDEREKLWLLWCASIRFTVGPSVPRPLPATQLFRGGGSAGKRSRAAQLASLHMHASRDKPAILPDFVLPPSCSGDNAIRGVGPRPGSGTFGNGGGSKGSATRGDGVFRIASSTSFLALDEEGVLAVEQPTMLLRCITTRPESGSVAMPTQSRLCPKMRWLQGPLRASRTPVMLSTVVGRPSSRNDASRQNVNRLDDDETTSQRSLTPANSHRPTLHASQPQPQPHQQHRGSNAAATTPASANITGRMQSSSGGSDAGASPAGGPDSNSAPRVVYSMADFPKPRERRELTTIEVAQGKRKDVADDNVTPALAILLNAPGGGGLDSRADNVPLTQGNFSVEMAMVLKLTRAPVNPRIQQSKGANGVAAMKTAKADIEFVMAFLECLRDASYSHFLLFDSEPLFFSVPKCHLGTGEVLEKLLHFVAGCGFSPVSLKDAVEGDRAVGRIGVVDDISYHHKVFEEDPADRAGSVACFRCNDPRLANSLSARMTPFFVVDLRNLHAEIEAHLLPGGGHSRSASNATTPTNDVVRK